ncbi:MAG TPA: hypothetical protein VF590_06660, partial [Isosphaeraceae bacterium]
SAASPTADPAAGPSPAEGVILALIPYANLAELAGRDQRVLLRLEDHERLRAWAAAQRPDPRPEGSIAATAARHRVRLDAEGDAIVESRYELRVDGAGARSWDVPVGEARDLAATLDGRGVPILIRPGGWTAVVAVAGAGRHDLVVRRSLPPRLTETGQVLRLPISPMATARAEVERPAPGLSIELPGARGPVAAAGATIEAELGPVDLLEVHWMPRAQADRSGRLEAVEGLLLWDVEPAGDRLRARWTVRNPGGADRFRLGLDPGLVVRSAAIPAPGVVDAGWLGSASAPEWVARFDPPLPDGATLTVELWRPAAAGGPEGADRSTARLPRVEPLGVGRSAGLMGFRRPADWSGRLGAIPGTEAIADEAFARAWGGLPREPLTLAGSSRFSGVPTAAVATGPVPPRPAIRPAVGLEVAPGRVGVRIDAELVDRGGRTFEVVAVLPERLVLTRVEADGLTDWSRPARDRLSLRFDGADAAPRRAIRLEGWLPVPADPLAPDDLRRELGVPWPRWPGAEEEPGLLTIAGAALAQITSREPAGVVKLPPGDATAPGRLAYRVERPEALNRLSWTAEPPRVDVAVRSWVRIDPGSAQWTARVDYQVSGGAIDAIRLKLPDAWAAVARAEVLGGGHRLAAEAAGEATGWTIRPAEPVWGGC